MLNKRIQKTTEQKHTKTNSMLLRQWSYDTIKSASIKKLLLGKAIYIFFLQDCSVKWMAPLLKLC